MIGLNLIIAKFKMKLLICLSFFFFFLEASTEDILANCLFFLYNVPVINITHNFEHELLFKMQGRFSAEIYT